MCQMCSFMRSGVVTSIVVGINVPFCQLIKHSVDHIETIGFREFSHKVRLDPLPWSIRCGDQLHLSKLLLVPMLCSAAHMAHLHILFDPICHVPSPVTLGDKLQGSESSQVPSDWGVMIESSTRDCLTLVSMSYHPSILIHHPTLAPWVYPAISWQAFRSLIEFPHWRW